MDWMDDLMPSTAWEWERMGRVPVANRDPVEGLRYFDIHKFDLINGKHCGPVSAGFFEQVGGDRARFLEDFLETWNEEIAKIRPTWKARLDMEVVEREDGRWVNVHVRKVPDDYEDGYYIVQTQPHAIEIAPVTITHHVRGEAFDPCRVSNAQLVAWAELSRGQTRDSIAWTWQCAIYSWMHCSMETPTSCGFTMHDVIRNAFNPVLRLWTETSRRVIGDHDRNANLYRQTDLFAKAYETDDRSSEVPSVRFGQQL